MTWIIAAIITLGALLAAIKAIIEFYEWIERKRNPPQEEQDE